MQRNESSDSYEYKFTNRQKEILELLCSGNTNKKIGSMLGLTESTIRTHLTTIFKMLQVSNRTEAGYRARKLGLILEGVV